ncbi:tRNA(Ser) Um(44) 2'-O-methyltransferase [Cordyceps fumosorosea ARSEF 2679]|uniref:tRNA (uracil-O(2)-)-methyltransferase n=1 Tax=Cordyceps fumosorosea (strain ARSEF 2679) TaxID=1081104 RepID=A0A167SXX7_CORFA|nr:tRNA(Ser) Um(44) 2'-O-methyltransferase [Cordyceps fumosorosea ARSEF 2679]OAA60045.1 tRNA(Ser) Um(44) 2'-O-methyltransferase [Cordyceps fumosorosea ARSEF 2679]
MSYDPDEFKPGASPILHEICSPERKPPHWEPLYRQGCTFGPQIFAERMLTFIRNPNLNTSWLFRGDILFDDRQEDENAAEDNKAPASVGGFDASWPERRVVAGMTRTRTMVRRLIPRNEVRDAPMNQTCEFHQTIPPQDDTAAGHRTTSTLVLYVPHATSAEAMPFYHPRVRAIAHLHEWDAAAGQGFISVHFEPFAADLPLADAKLRRVGYHLLERLHKHGQGSLRGYAKRVHHDAVVPQKRFQDRFAALKRRHARALMGAWAESTDPAKHVFEDLGIAAFLIELWADMYGAESEAGPGEGGFPGFVDIGCGNGLLVHILNQEGYRGWGFDARARKSWAQYSTTPSEASPTGSSLAERCLMPSVVPRPEGETPIDDGLVHDGLFPRGTFIISNHADELTPWTPILGALSDCPWISIPCCSHDLAGARFRAPPPRDRSKSKSTYASLVDWVARIAEDCGWQVETEMLRIPSTRNTGLLGRRRTKETKDVDIAGILAKYGGVEGYYASIAKLVKTGPRSH